jgi:ribose transport system permease protein
LKINFSQIAQKTGPLLALVFVYLLFSISPQSREAFVSTSNAKIILTQSVITSLAALGMTMIIISGGIDLSVGSVVALTSVLGAIFLNKGINPSIVVMLVIILGASIGAVSGALVTNLRMMPFIVTLGVLGFARGSAKWIANEQTVSVPKTWINDLMVLFPQPDWIVFAPGIWITAFLAFVLSLIMQSTIFGRYIYAIGSNESTAHLCGIKVKPLKVIIYAVAGAFFGLAGLMQLSRLRQGDPTVAVGLELDVIAAVVIGGASLSGGTGSVFGSTIGALIMAILRNGSQQMGWPTYIQEIIIGGVIIIAVSIDRWRQKLSQS